MKLKLLSGLFSGLVLAMIAPAASAYDVVYVAGNEQLCATGANGANDQSDLEAAVKSAACGGSAAQELYKANVGGVDEKTFSNSYNTTFFNTATDPEDATISWVTGTPSIQCSTIEKCFLGVKDGNTNPPFYVFNISDWDGTSSIVLTGFWAGTGDAGKGAISNVSIWSSGDGIIDDDDIPEPASLALVGIALLAAGAARRRRRA